MRTYKIIILGSSYLTELVVERLRKEYVISAGTSYLPYHLVGYIPAKKTTIPGKIDLPLLQSLDVEHDIKLSVQYDRKLSDIDRAYNVHTGLLPEYGGLNILSHTLANGDREQGITFHRMTEEFDAGAIISKVTYPVFKGDTPLDLYRRVALLIPGFVHSSLSLLRTLSEEQIAGCFSYPPRLYQRGEFKLDESFKKFRAEREGKR